MSSKEMLDSSSDLESPNSESAPCSSHGSTSPAGRATTFRELRDRLNAMDDLQLDQTVIAQIDEESGRPLWGVQVQQEDLIYTDHSTTNPLDVVARSEAEKMEQYDPTWPVVCKAGTVFLVLDF